MSSKVFILKYLFQYEKIGKKKGENHHNLAKFLTFGIIFAKAMLEFEFFAKILTIFDYHFEKMGLIIDSMRLA